ncbi:hypothetical protein SDC9_106540 [bioreactor metagenome]|uniref:Fimbrial protein n=1 Tax=bioreactor metagenome TaxID=1076179 RepID=A0A645BDB7_9ZZZZ|nr:prepilin-type N-terminal cleavage/methylation domain-containing protein [Candidatus Metalachnospira sp.]
MNKLNALRKKLKNKKGFTLMEMLIVVAIIVILLAIAIPSFNNALRKSKLAADEANVRAWYAQVMVDLMTDPEADVPSEYKGGTLQLGDVADSDITGDSAENFKVVYKTTDGDDTMSFPQS